MTKVQYLALGLVESHYGLVGPLFTPVQVITQLLF